MTDLLCQGRNGYSRDTNQDIDHYQAYVSLIEPEQSMVRADRSMSSGSAKLSRVEPTLSRARFR